MDPRNSSAIAVACSILALVNVAVTVSRIDTKDQSSIGAAGGFVADVHRLPQHDDNAIVELVLVDLSTYNGPGRPFSLAPKVSREIYLSTEPLAWPPHAEEPLERNSVFDAISSSGRQAIYDAITDIKARYESGDQVSGFSPMHGMLHVVDSALSIGDATDDTPYSALYPIQAFPPCYSPDGTCAVVHLYVPEIMHPSDVTYVLIAIGGQWTITHRGFVMYL